MKAKEETTKKGGHERAPLEGFGINPNKLEAEALRQIELMSEYSELMAEATYQVVRLENRKKRLRSEILMKNQHTAKNQQIAEAMYRVDKDYIELSNRLAQAIYEKERMQNAMYLLAQRRDMIDFFLKRNLALSGSSTFNSNIAPSVKKKGV